MGGREGCPDGTQEADLADLAGVGVGDGEDGVEDSGEVERVERGGEVGGDDGARVGDSGGRLLAEGAALYAVELEVDPPYPWYGYYTP